MAKIKMQTDIQRSTKHTHKTKDRILALIMKVRTALCIFLLHKTKYGMVDYRS